MPASRIRADYDTLARIAKQFGRQADSTQNTLRSIKQHLGTLQSGDWIGVGANAFYREMDQEVVPSLTRLAKALEQAQLVTTQISKIIKDAEDSAAGFLRGTAASGAGGAGTQAAESGGAVAAGVAGLADWFKSVAGGLNIGSWTFTGLGRLASNAASRLNAALAGRLEQMASIFARGGEEALSKGGIHALVAGYMTNSARAAKTADWLNKGSTGLSALGAGATSVGQGMASSAETWIGKITSGGAAGAFSWAMRNNPYVFAGDMVGMATGLDGPSTIMNSSFESIVVTGEGLVTGSTRGMESLHQRQLNGEWGGVFKAAAEAGDFWADHGVVGGLGMFWNEVKSVF
jgi:WXG100 family type VII secretion target